MPCITNHQGYFLHTGNSLLLTNFATSVTIGNVANVLRWIFMECTGFHCEGYLLYMHMYMSINGIFFGKNIITSPHTY